MKRMRSPATRERVNSLLAVTRRISLLPGSSYQEDEDCASSLLQQTCIEQEWRLHTLFLLDDYLSRKHGGRKYELIQSERRMLHELYEAVWAELGLAFRQDIVAALQAAVESSVGANCAVSPQYALF